MDKRTRRRKKTSLPVRFGTDRPEKMGLITDVSAHGVYISTNVVLPRGTLVHLSVRLSGGETLVLKGHVMRARRVASALASVSAGGLGIRLEDPPAHWRTSLAIPEQD